jgi:flagellar basal body-associated protein FliL
MAEIHVQTKKRSSPGSMWIWIVLVLVIAAAVIYYFTTRNKTAGTAAPPANTTSLLRLPSAPPAQTGMHAGQNVALHCVNSIL